MTDHQGSRIESSKVLVTEITREQEREIPIGQKIKTIRKKKKFSLEYVANETGYSVKFLKKIENVEITPPVGTLLNISRALEMDSGYFLQEDYKTAVSRVEAYTKRTENYAYTSLTPDGAEKKHLKAFKIILEPMQEHKGVGYQHEGEEFEYVLSGEVEISVGDNVTHLKAGESLHFNSGIKHKLKNLANKKAELLIIVYVP
ncbi:XRE family transcriptional regulator [Candidatus Magnetomoraceae bacterium gMMP-15]